jgi:hypothetical protein
MNSSFSVFGTIPALLEFQIKIKIKHFLKENSVTQQATES